MDNDYQGLEQQFDERVVEIARVAKVVKGGRRFSFRVTVITGDNRGKVGLGVGKANAVPEAMRKATDRAHKNMTMVNLHGTTIPHEVTGKKSGARVLLKRPRRERASSLRVVYTRYMKLPEFTISSPSRWAAPMCSMWSRLLWKPCPS